jgi:hypothetical protein
MAHVNRLHGLPQPGYLPVNTGDSPKSTMSDMSHVAFHIKRFAFAISRRTAQAYMQANQRAGPTP